MRLSTFERKLLNCIQRELPISSQPFKLLAKELKLNPSILISKVKDFKKRGIIRRLSASLNHKNLGYKSSLLALKVPKIRLKEFVKEAVLYPEITHCYLRNNEYNLWIVFIYKGNALKKFLRKLSSLIGKKNILNLKTIKEFKLNTRINV